MSACKRAGGVPGRLPAHGGVERKNQPAALCRLRAPGRATSPSREKRRFPARAEAGAGCGYRSVPEAIFRHQRRKDAPSRAGCNALRASETASPPAFQSSIRCRGPAAAGP